MYLVAWSLPVSMGNFVKRPAPLCCTCFSVAGGKDVGHGCSWQSQWKSGGAALAGAAWAHGRCCSAMAATNAFTVCVNCVTCSWSFGGFGPLLGEVRRSVTCCGNPLVMVTESAQATARWRPSWRPKSAAKAQLQGQFSGT